MASRDPRLDAYVAKAAPFAQPILHRLRTLIPRACPDAQETLRWGHPSWTYRGTILCGVAAFKQHLNFGFWNRDAAKAAVRLTGGADVPGRLTADRGLPSDAVVIRWVKEAVRRIDAGTPSRPIRRPVKKRAVAARKTFRDA
ncbi:MAG TPA: DUF1801 domain-containing protein [Gemmatimonadales bacterium]|nr:DUF1801 domain-containing protein [Gemmatimonadales bacterium]